MRAVVQRVSRAAVRETTTGEVLGRLGDNGDNGGSSRGPDAQGLGGGGLCVLLGIGHGDTQAEAEWLADKVCGLRIFPDPPDPDPEVTRQRLGNLNRSLRDVGGALLVISQFTLYADTSRGRRPSFTGAMPPTEAAALYEYFVATLRSQGYQVATGRFGAMMSVELVNEGPVTIWLDSRDASKSPPPKRPLAPVIDRPLARLRDRLGEGKFPIQGASGQRSAKRFGHKLRSPSGSAPSSAAEIVPLGEFRSLHECPSSQSRGRRGLSEPSGTISAERSQPEKPPSRRPDSHSSRPNKALTAALLAAATLASPTLSTLFEAPAYASLPDLISLGTRSPALGGTGVADATGYEASYQNPAGLATGSRNLTLGLIYGGYRTTIDGNPYPIENTLGLTIGGSLPLPLGGIMKNRLGLGLGLYLPTGFVNRVRVPLPEEPRAALLDSRTQIVSVLFGGGLRLPWGLSVGGGVLALAALVGNINIQPDGTGRITSISEEQLTISYAPIVGVRWQSPSGLVALGATFHGVSQSSYKIVVHTNLGDALPIMLPLIYFSGIAQYDPLQVATEVAVRPTRRLLLTAQACWKHWQDYAYPIDKATVAAPAPPLPRFHDTVVPRVGVEWQPTDFHAVELVLRAGYFFEWSPAPDPPPDDLSRNLLDSNRHVITAGVGVRLRGRVPLQFAAFGQGHVLAPSARLSGGFGTMGVSVGLDL